MGKVLSSPKATNPSIVMYSSDRPKIKNNIAEHRLCGVRVDQVVTGQVEAVLT
jgi:hypothetical protein